MKEREPVIVGIAEAELREGKLAGGESVLGIQARMAKAALDDAGLALADVDGLLTAGMWGMPGPGSLPTVTLSEYLGIMPSFCDGTNIGGSAFEAHLGHAAAAIQQGICEVALICYGSTQRSEQSRTLGGRTPVRLTRSSAMAISRAGRTRPPTI